MSKKIRSILEALAALATIISLLIVIIPDIPGPWKHTVINVTSTEKFQLDIIRSKYGKDLNLGDRFSYFLGIGVPISVYGFTEYDDNTTVWVVLRDIYGKYYVQNPPAEMLNGEWKAMNIRPLNDIADIMFITVDIDGHNFLFGKVSRKDWGSFPNLPVNSKILGLIELD